MDVLDTYAVEDDAFAVQWEFVEPLAFHCMFQPAGTPDRLNALRNIDSASYKERTRNFRNLASHAIAPRLGWGYTNIARRVLVAGPAPYPFGARHAAKRDHHVAYPFGGTPPIPVREAFELNLAEYALAVDAIVLYGRLLDEVLAQLPVE